MFICQYFRRVLVVTSFLSPLGPPVEPIAHVLMHPIAEQSGHLDVFDLTIHRMRQAVPLGEVQTDRLLKQDIIRQVDNSFPEVPLVVPRDIVVRCEHCGVQPTTFEIVKDFSRWIVFEGLGSPQHLRVRGEKRLKRVRDEIRDSLGL